MLVHHHCTHQATHERAVNLVITDGHFNLPQLFVWVCIGLHTHFINLRKYILQRKLILISKHMNCAKIKTPQNLMHCFVQDIAAFSATRQLSQ